MFDSVVGFSVSFTRQCCGIGSGGACRAVAAGVLPRGGGGGAGAGGGVKMPAGTTSADITVVCGVESAFRPSQFVEVPAARRRAAINIGVPVLSTFNFQLSTYIELFAFNFLLSIGGYWRGGLRCVLRTRGDVGRDRDQILRRQVRDDELHELRL